MRFLPRRRWLRWSIIFVVGIVVVFLASEVFSEIQWRRYVSAARVRGAKFTVAELKIPEIPDSENFAAQVYFRGTKAAGGLRPRYKVYEDLSLPPLRLTQRAPDGAGWIKAFDLAGWRTLMLNAKWMDDSIPGETAGAGVLRGLKMLEKDLSELRAARSRPSCNFKVNWTDQLGATNESYSAILSMGRLLSLRIAACCEEQLREETVESLRDLSRLGTALESEPAMMGFLMWKSVHAMFIESLRRSIEAKVLRSEDLDFFEKELRKVDVRKLLAWMVDTERVYYNTTAEWMMERRFEPNMGFEANSPLGQLFQSPDGKFMRALMLTRRFWRSNQLENHRLLDASMQFSASPEWQPAEIAASRPDEDRDWADRVFKPFVYAVTSHTLVENGLFVDTMTRSARLQCALERFRLAHEKFPENLAELVPSILEAMPNDPVSRSPFHYQRTQTGYRLYAVGIDGKDGGGNAGEKDKNWREKPDLVWPFPATLPFRN